jgi:hypothetical protein
MMLVIPLAAIVGAPACDANPDLAVKVLIIDQIQTIVDILEPNGKS